MVSYCMESSSDDRKETIRLVGAGNCVREIKRHQAEMSGTLRNMISGRSYSGFIHDEDDLLNNTITVYLPYIKERHLQLICDYLRYKLEFEEFDFSKANGRLPPDFAVPMSEARELILLADFLDC
ncbi:hypothetical protein L596_009724 [Steinernema carpocapsae]|uniref:Elongin-C n=1 Tax=Steinernema carpocapsae TaxID=34508 RepID=A0A4U5PG64_STECR|nr:hypothetical protein L596_009724 [Steinernema carpocapsae]